MRSSREDSKPGFGGPSEWAPMGQNPNQGQKNFGPAQNQNNAGGSPGQQFVEQSDKYAFRNQYADQEQGNHGGPPPPNNEHGGQYQPYQPYLPESDANHTPAYSGNPNLGQGQQTDITESVWTTAVIPANRFSLKKLG